MFFTRTLCCAAGLAAPLALAQQAFPDELVDLGFSPADQTAKVGDIVDVAVVAVSTGPASEEFWVLEAIFQWDASVLELLGNDDSGSEAAWLYSGFDGAVDGINDTWADGDAFYAAFAPPSVPAVAPIAPGDLVVTTLRFRVLAETQATELRFVPLMGEFAETHVLTMGPADVTGDISSTASVSTPNGGTECPADIDGDGEVNVEDFLFLLNAWGPNPGSPADIDGDGVVGIDDFLILLQAWGPCP